jgi:hypothetical protein
MTASAPGSNLGRLLFGSSALAFGIITLILPDYYDWLLLHFTNAQIGRVFAIAASVAQIFGGAAIQFRGIAKTGAVVLGAVYLIISLLSVPQIVASPLVYAPWGNFFEEFSLVTGAAIVYASLSSRWTPETVDRVGRILFAVCAASFALFQGLYPNETNVLVPKWLPPNQIFWTVATTVFFGLACVAILINRMAVLASRLLTLMIVIFGLVVWLPSLFSDPHNHTNWTETALNFAIAGAAWILADFLAGYTVKDHSPAIA